MSKHGLVAKCMESETSEGYADDPDSILLAMM